MPELLEAIVLGFIQGFTEFLPVSSSGHIATFTWLFGMEDAGLGLAIVLHMGTLLSTLLVFRRDVFALMSAALDGVRSPRRIILAAQGQDKENMQMAVAVVVGTLPTALVGLSLKTHIEVLAHSPYAVGIAFLGTAVLLLSTRRNASRETPRVPNPREAFLIGLAQAVAIAPGVSRSGSTIAVALMLGIGATTAFRLSLLLSLPAVAGAALLLLLDARNGAALPLSVWFGGVIAFAVGLVALVLLRGVVHRGRLWYFAIYLVPLGLGVFTYGVVGHD